MNDLAEDHRFLSALESAVRRTVRAVLRDRPGETLAGYALCTDDGLETLFHRSVTDAVLESSANQGLLFCPTDWSCELEAEAFDTVDGELRRRAAAAVDLRAHVDSSFGLLIDALAELKREGVFAPSVFLSVLSTDPNEYLEELENSSVRRLNEPSVVSARQGFLDRWI